MSELCGDWCCIGSITVAHNILHVCVHNKKNLTLIQIHAAALRVDSYPGYGGGEKRPDIDCLHMHDYSQKTPESVYVWKLPVKSTCIRPIYSVSMKDVRITTFEYLVH